MRPTTSPAFRTRSNLLTRYHRIGECTRPEAVLRTILLVLIIFVALSLSTSAARAGANGSWCANYGTGLDGAINCSYTSFEQCRATVSGIYGFCTPNPYPGTSY